ncbi:hypothetical protein AAZX31_10G274500 [Glycine max]
MEVLEGFPFAFSFWIYTTIPIHTPMLMQGFLSCFGYHCEVKFALLKYSTCFLGKMRTPISWHGYICMPSIILTFPCCKELQSICNLT